MQRHRTLVLIITAFAMLCFGGTATSHAQSDLPDWQYYGYKITHHMGAVVEHMEKFGFNEFDHPPISDFRSFVITPALDHFYSKAVTDLRWGPVIIDTPAKDDRYSSLEIFDMEHHATFDTVLDMGGQRFVLAHVDYTGKMPEGTEIRSHSHFPFVFIRTQTFAFNADKLSDGIRRQSRIYGLWEAIDLPSPKDPQALIDFTIEHSKPYPQTKELIAKAAESYTADLHRATFESIKAFMASGGVAGNPGMFEPVDHPAGGSHKIRAAGCFLGHLGFPVHHAYYQQIPVNSKGEKLSGAGGPFVVTVPHDPGVKLFWSVTRYGADTFLPLNPADIGNQNIQAFNAFNTTPDKDGNVTFTFSKEDPKDGTYWMPVTDSGYYLIFRYYGPAKTLNGNTAVDIIYGGTPLAERFKAVNF